MRNKRIIYISCAVGSFIVVHFFNVLKGKVFQGNSSDIEYYLESIRDMPYILGGLAFLYSSLNYTKFALLYHFVGYFTIKHIDIIYCKNF